ncbi:uncharacterized protein CEXT_429961 [Caerostris extrusa]|uniref:Transmembrane protein n=1 Tax=Caerostris extrusa TaxID=172846 RepID=A0AAV4RZ14_CAEEX|nr:uncharacterized protein CEXT_429961 [Caerostris extrusa]
MVQNEILNTFLGIRLVQCDSKQTMLVAIFYAAIILIVVGSNCHRFRKHHSSSDRGVRRAAKHLLTFADNKLNIFHIVLKRHRSPNSSNPQIAIV